MVRIDPVALFARRLAQYVEAREQLDGFAGRWDRQPEYLGGARPRHYRMLRQLIQQLDGGDGGAPVVHQPRAIAGKQRVQCLRDVDAVVVGLADTLEEECRPALPVAVRADRSQAGVVLLLAPAEGHAEVQQRVLEQAPALDQQRYRRCLVNVPTDVEHSFWCEVTNLDTGCEAVSNACGISLREPVTIADQPASQTVAQGDTVTLSVVAAGTPPLSHQWRRFGVPLEDGGNVSGAATANLVIVSISPAQAGAYDCVVGNACGSMASAAALLCVETGYGAGPGDLNCDGCIDFADINPFVLALSAGESGYYASFPQCHWHNGDLDCDGVVRFGDINPFVALLTGN